MYEFYIIFRINNWVSKTRSLLILQLNFEENAPPTPNTQNAIWAPIQYKDAVLPVLEIPMWR